MNRRERFSEFLRRLAAAPPASTAQDALTLIGLTLTAVEDEHSGVPDTPDTWRTDGRLYPPQWDRRLKHSPIGDTICLRTVAHRLFLSDDGAILILDLDGDGRWFFEKAGKNGTVVLRPRPPASAP